MYQGRANEFSAGSELLSVAWGSLDWPLEVLFHAAQLLSGTMGQVKLVLHMPCQLLTDNHN